VYGSPHAVLSSNSEQVHNIELYRQTSECCAISVHSVGSTVGIPKYSQDGSGVGSCTGAGVPQSPHEAGQISSGSVVIVLCSKVKEGLPTQIPHKFRSLKPER